MTTLPRPLATTGAITTRVGKQIRAHRRKQGMTQPELAAQLATQGWHVDYTQLSRIETGRQLLYPDMLWAITRALAITPNDLFITRD